MPEEEHKTTKGLTGSAVETIDNGNAGASETPSIGHASSQLMLRDFLERIKSKPYKFGLDEAGRSLVDGKHHGVCGGDRADTEVELGDGADAGADLAGKAIASVELGGDAGDTDGAGELDIGHIADAEDDTPIVEASTAASFDNLGVSVCEFPGNAGEAARIDVNEGEYRESKAPATVADPVEDFVNLHAGDAGENDKRTARDAKDKGTSGQNHTGAGAGEDITVGGDIGDDSQEDIKSATPLEHSSSRRTSRSLLLPHQQPVTSAMKKPLTVKRGGKSSPLETPSNPASVKPYLGFVPNFALLDSIKWLPHDAVGRKLKKFNGLRWAFHLAVIFGKSAQVRMPVTLLAQVVWGGDKAAWPTNWRNELVRVIEASSNFFKHVEHLEATSKGDCCGPDCLMYASGEKHHHLLVTIQTLVGEISGNEEAKDDIDEDANRIDRTFLGLLELCGSGEDSDRRYDFRKPKPVKSKPKKRQGKEPATLAPTTDDENDGAEGTREGQLRMRWGKRIISAYFPLLLFGSSPRMGLSGSQQLLMRAITREITRDPKGSKSPREDHAEVLTVGPLKGKTIAGSATYYPHLKEGRYVAFNGNGKGKKERMHGRGYALGSWLERAHYLVDVKYSEPVTPEPPKYQFGIEESENDHDDEFADPTVNNPSDEPAENDTHAKTQKLVKTAEEIAYWKAVKKLHADLTSLADIFDLSFGLYHPKKREWHSLALVTKLMRSDSGRRWLRQARLRIYAPEDYLFRWRGVFAKRMGFSVIRAPGDEEVESNGQITSPAELRQYLKDNNLTQAMLAKKLGVPASKISALLAANLTWSQNWKRKIASFLTDEVES